MSNKCLFGCFSLGMMEILPGRCVPIAKRELMYAGTAGLACWLAGVIFINRKKTDDAISVMTEAAETMLKEDVRNDLIGGNGGHCGDGKSREGKTKVLPMPWLYTSNLR